MNRTHIAKLTPRTQAVPISPQVQVPSIVNAGGDGRDVLPIDTPVNPAHLTAETREQIECCQSEVHTAFSRMLWLISLLSPLPSSLLLDPVVPAPPRQPLRLFSVLQRYAAALFDCEDRTYPQTGEPFSWRNTLAPRIEKLVMETALKWERGLRFHASPDEMLASVRAGLADHMNKLAQQASDASVARATLVPDTPQAQAEVKRQHGPRRDFGTAMTVDEVIRRLAPDGNWRAKLADICESLDEDQVCRPKRWKGKGHRTWYDCMIAERSLVIKAIGHHLELAREHKRTLV